MVILFGLFVKSKEKGMVQDSRLLFGSVVEKSKKCSNWGSNPRPSRY